MAKKAADSGRFAQHASAPSYRLIVRSWGLDKTGKNHFGFTAPGPIFGQYLTRAALKASLTSSKRGSRGVCGEGNHVPYLSFPEGDDGSGPRDRGARRIH
jgi:hypothetical protein